MKRLPTSVSTSFLSRDHSQSQSAGLSIFNVTSHPHLQNRAEFQITLCRASGSKVTKDAIGCRWPLETLLASLKRHSPRRGERSVFIEYVMLQGVNDTMEDAHRLVDLLQDIECKINLIGFNAHEGTRFKPSPEEQILAFRYTGRAKFP